MSLLGMIRIVAKPDQLKTTSEAAAAQIRIMQGEWSAITNVVKNTNNYWKGNAADQKRAAFAKKEQEINDILHRFQQYPTELMEIAGVYETGEKQNVSTAQMLSSDVIV